MLAVPIPTLLHGPRGSLFMNPLRDSIKGCVTVPLSGNMPAVAPARTAAGGANGLSPPILIQAPTSAWLEVFSLFVVNGAAVDADVIARQCVLISTYSNGVRRFMRRPINVTHVFGTRLNPFFLDDPYSEPFLLAPNETAQFDFVNPSTVGDTSIRFGMECRKIQTKALEDDPKINAAVKALYSRRRHVYPIWMPLTSDAQNSTVSLGVPGVRLAASGSFDTTFVHDNSDGPVMITRVLATGLTTGVAGDTTELFNCTLYDGRTNRVLMNQPVVMNCLGGPATFAYTLPTPLVVDRQEIVRATFTNLVTDQATDAFVTLQGLVVED